ncbi:putative uncharacterized protein DDB_G0282133 isoform X2 [Galleria mellonella]|nr:putative uncharacterized protein DDB_G0282133 isoform X2 [Galleria mellonella]XP_031765221.2 putative uncharacterized protein DDB_G0282133 isoform X2 [Galleria mellonella]XP_031765222.2 putative uncharacterized protein DDB_G0282133 isoform X2 [Galleria mellonella]XP_052759555.1 putative uncharacterized protein DDB_G0282133 isoform X2 [Galleria mellonella]XP_052759556.1 putative uncharacterized protein DDB_G0282133 isoform X2 [Galleria mellonella]
MTDAYREQRPLLGETFVDEDHYSPQYPRRFRPVVLKNRTKSKLRGAVSIFKRWPSYWSTAFVYWWIGLGMIVITTFIIYNGFVAFALLPPEHISSLMPKPITNNNVIKTTSNKDSILLDVFMHVLIDSHDNMDFKTYLPYIEIISNKYYKYNYHLVIIFNDTNNSVLSAEENNDMALNLLWDETLIKPNLYRNNILIEYTTLSKYMNNSPLRKYWRNIPSQFIEFLIRALSIWEKGGIAFNPTVLTPQTPHSIYIEKIYNILMKYESKLLNNNTTPLKKYNEGNKYQEKIKSKVNNIQDIIHILELDNNSETNNKNNIDESSKYSNMVQIDTKNNTNVLNNNDFKNVSDKYETLTMAESKTDLTNIKTYHKQNSTDITSSLLPLFLKFLFNDLPINNTKENYSDTSKKVITRNRKSVLMYDDKKQNVIDNYIPMIIPTRNKNNNVVNITDVNEIPKNNAEELTIDLKGNIIATKIPCHAFLGTIFNNISHQNKDKTITDFLIQELILFCKGLLSKCNGIDIILL